MRLPTLLVLALAMGGCSLLENDAEHGVSYNAWSVPTAVTTADVRIVTDREHPLLHNRVVCTEPTPDVAKAISTSLAAAAQGGYSGASGSLNLSGAQAEAVAELAGRSTALLGLRDTLYRACEAYTNGIIGQDVYSLIVSQYAQLMATLFLGQDVTGLKSNVSALTSSPILQLPAPASTPASQTTTTTTMTAGNAKKTGVRAIEGRLPIVAAFDRERVPLLPVADTPGASGEPSATVDKGATAAPTSPSSPPSVTTDASAVGALTLARMGEDFMHSALLPALVVACINDGDPTRDRSRMSPDGNYQESALPGNLWLAVMCKSLPDIIKIKEDALSTLEKKENWDPVHPEQGVVLPKETASLAQKAASKPASDPVIEQVQAALKRAGCVGCDPGMVDGLNGPSTKKAVAAFWKSKHVPGNDNPKDPNLLLWLGINGPRL